jgi:SpoVK/Ycf46/Vps4 family AAA+-type ATPase
MADPKETKPTSSVSVYEQKPHVVIPGSQILFDALQNEHGDSFSKSLEYDPEGVYPNIDILVSAVNKDTASVFQYETLDNARALVLSAKLFLSHRISNRISADEYFDQNVLSMRDKLYYLGIPSEVFERNQMPLEPTDKGGEIRRGSIYALVLELGEFHFLATSSLDLRAISLYIVNSEGKYISLGDIQNFRQTLKYFSKAIEALVQATYQIEGLTPISKQLEFVSQEWLEERKVRLTPDTEEGLEQEVLIERPDFQKPDLSFEDVAGQDEAVREAKKLVLAINQPEIYEKHGAKRPKGILLWGPPGTGKTILAKALAGEIQAEFLEFSVTDILTKWYGESPQNTQRLFDRANELAEEGKKVVLFFDEMDGLAPSRGDAWEETRKIVGVILQNMDGSKANPNVIIVGATNRPEDMDEALKRPGRFDKHVHVGLPDTEGRIDILKLHIKKAMERALVPAEVFAEDLNWDVIGLASDGMSGADLESVVNRTIENKTIREIEGEEWEAITVEDMVQVVEFVKTEKAKTKTVNRRH